MEVKQLRLFALKIIKTFNKNVYFEKEYFENKK